MEAASFQLQPLPSSATSCHWAPAVLRPRPPSHLAGTLLGALMLNRELGRRVVGDDTLAAICRAILQSGRLLTMQ